MPTHPTVPLYPPQAEEYLPVPWSTLEDYRCFGCSPQNSQGLRLRFAVRPDGIETRFRLDRAHESYPGIVHGGLIGVICDETMGNLIVLRTGLTSFTTALRLRYVNATRVDADYRCVARLLTDQAPNPAPTSTGGLIHAEAEVLDAAGGLVAAATATYRPTSMDSARRRLDLQPEEFDRIADALNSARTWGPTQGATQDADQPS
jgi:acyl-coenzyme A thioesterase PaaI-like protein